MEEVVALLCFATYLFQNQSFFGVFGSAKKSSIGYINITVFSIIAVIK